LLVEVAVMPRIFWLWAATSVLLFAAVSRGEELPVAEAAAAGASENIAALIEQLDWSAFVERQAASQQLEELGVAALAHLEAAVASLSRETSARALAILKRHFQSGVDEIKQPAREALLRLAQSDNPSTAQRARDVLNPPKQVSLVTPAGPQPGMMPPPNNNFGGFGVPAGFNFGRGLAPAPGGIRRISISDVNGRKVVDIDERERRVIIETAPGGGIHIEVTDKQNARNPMRTFDAKDVGELTRKDAELGRLYEQYHAAGQRPPGGVAPPAFPPFGFAPLNPAQRTLELLEQSRQRTRGMIPADDLRRAVR
jgi:hypothetical protein